MQLRFVEVQLPRSSYSMSVQGYSLLGHGSILSVTLLRLMSVSSNSESSFSSLKEWARKSTVGSVGLVDDSRTAGRAGRAHHDVVYS